MCNRKVIQTGEYLNQYKEAYLKSISLLPEEKIDRQNQQQIIYDASKIYSFGAVTYSNEYKIKMGVDKNIIDTYSVYSMQTANEMSKKISMFTSSDFGVGITGKLNKKDPNNLYGDDNKVYISVYDRKNDTFYNKEVTVNSFDRKENKDYVLNEVFSLIYGLL